MPNRNLKGHTGHCCSLILEGDINFSGEARYKHCALVGDLWDEKGDESFWRDLSEQPDVQLKSRNFILSTFSDAIIVPGHGEPFLVSEMNHM